MIVPHDAAERFAAELAVLLLVHFLEDRALVPGRALELFQVLAQLLFGEVHDADFEHLVGFRVIDEIMQAAPGSLQLLEVIVVDNLVDLFGQLFIDLGDDRLDGLDGVVGNQGGFRQRLLSQGFNRGLHQFPGAVGFGLEFFLQQRGKIAGFQGSRFRLRCLCVGFCFSHRSLLLPATRHPAAWEPPPAPSAWWDHSAPGRSIARRRSCRP